MPEVLEAGSPEWWLRKLESELDGRRARLDRFDAYYEGRHRMAFSSEKFRQAFGSLFSAFADNWCDLVVDAVEERLTVEGFRFGTGDAGTTSSDGQGEPDEPDAADKADKDAWRIWQENQLDAESQVAHTEALINGESYALVWYGDDDRPLITVEHPTQMIVGYPAGARRDRAAALKKWQDDDGFVLATLYLPDEIYKWRSATKVKDPSSGRRIRWVQRDVDGEDWPLDNPLGAVPVVPIVNRRRLLLDGQSEIKKVIPVQDAVNKLVADMMVASEFAAFRQRWATGVEIPTDPDTGQPIETWKSAVDRVWRANPALDEDGNAVGPEPKFGEFSPSDPSTYVQSVEMLVQHIASQTRTPPHYFYLRGEFPSGESIKSAETGLVSKSRRKMRHFGESWEEVIRLAFRVLDDPRADVIDSETIWADPESRTEAQHVDAVSKKKDLGVPFRQPMEDLGYTPQQIERIVQDREREQLEAARLAATFESLVNAGGIGGDGTGAG